MLCRIINHTVDQIPCISMKCQLLSLILFYCLIHCQLLLDGKITPFLILFNHMTLLVHLKAALPSTPYTTGTFEYSHMMYIPIGKTGYFNFSENVPNWWKPQVNLMQMVE